MCAAATRHRTTAGRAEPFGRANLGADGDVREDSTPGAAPWRAKVLKSLARNKKLANSRYVQLATIRDGRPANRSVVFR